MAGLAPPVAAVRVAVRRALLGLRGQGRCLVACSGGADSLALAAAAAFVAPRLGVSCGLITIDHRLQEGSGAQAAAVVRWARTAGLDPALAVAVDVAGRRGGPEAAAREARYQALCQVALDREVDTVLLGHTRDDQAETVLLALARGGGPRGLAGMPPSRRIDGVTFLRPLLDVRRADTRAACVAQGLTGWEDPHNSDPSYARARIRAALPLLTGTLGAGLIDNLARTAMLAAADNAALDTVADRVGRAARDGGSLLVAVLAGQPAAVRTRVLREFAAEIGARALSHRHLTALDALVADWHGQGPVSLPGGIKVARRNGLLVSLVDRSGG